MNECDLRFKKDKSEKNEKFEFEILNPCVSIQNLKSKKISESFVRKRLTED